MSEQKKEEKAKLTAEQQAIQDGIREGIAMGLMAVEQARARAESVQMRPEAQLTPGELRMRCPDCGQLKIACKGKHAMLLVWPQNERYAEHFDGVYLNGVRYKSPDANTRIAVPAENSILNSVRCWEESENDLRMGRKKTHRTGNLSPIEGNTRVNPFNGPGFSG